MDPRDGYESWPLQTIRIEVLILPLLPTPGLDKSLHPMDLEDASFEPCGLPQQLASQ